MFGFNASKQDCKTFMENTSKLLTLSCRFGAGKSSYREIVCSNADDQLFEVHVCSTNRDIFEDGKCVGNEILYRFTKPPRKISLDKFLKTAEQNYPGIGILYEGINETNLRLYADARSDWNAISKGSGHLKAGDIDRSCIKYVFELRHGEFSLSRRYPLLELSEFLFEQGFYFSHATVGGGIDEVSHTGTVAYRAEYDRFEDFRDNFAADIENATVEVQKAYNGWGVLDYRWISVTLEKDSLSALISIAAHGIEILWRGIEKAPDGLINEVNAKAMSLLDGNADLRRHMLKK